MSPRPRVILAGATYGSLTVIADREGAAKYVRARCACGNEHQVQATDWGRTKSCGCLSSRSGDYIRTHGRSTTVEYQAWRNMLARCYDTGNNRYADYGGRGITVVDRWHTFENFYADMGRRPSADLSLDRIDNDGRYEPGNCRWVTHSVQMRNRRQRTHCKRGHEFTPANTRTYRGDRYCRACDRDRARQKRQDQEASS